jgi:hypothetical protein
MKYRLTRSTDHKNCKIYNNNNNNNNNKDLTIEMQHALNVKTTATSVIKGATGTIHNLSGNI